MLSKRGAKIITIIILFSKNLAYTGFLALQIQRQSGPFDGVENKDIYYIKTLEMLIRDPHPRSSSISAPPKFQTISSTFFFFFFGVLMFLASF